MYEHTYFSNYVVVLDLNLDLFNFKTLLANHTVIYGKYSESGYFASNMEASF